MKQQIYSVNIKDSSFHLLDLHSKESFTVPFKSNFSKLLELDLHFRKSGYWDINLIWNTKTEFHLTCKSVKDWKEN